MMTKKHFKALARIVFDAQEAHNGGLTPQQRSMLAGDLASFCHAENPNFDRQRFLEACMTGRGC